MRADVLVRVGPERVPRPAVAPAALRAAPHDDVNASPTSIGSVVDERIAVTPMPMPSPSHRATATRVHFAPTTEESNNS